MTSEVKKLIVWSLIVGLIWATAWGLAFYMIVEGGL